MNKFGVIEHVTYESLFSVNNTFQQVERLQTEITAPVIGNISITENFELLSTKSDIGYISITKWTFLS
jgi:hypothetical protein